MRPSRNGTCTLHWRNGETFFKGSDPLTPGQESVKLTDLSQSAYKSPSEPVFVRNSEGREGKEVLECKPQTDFMLVFWQMYLKKPTNSKSFSPWRNCCRHGTCLISLAYWFVYQTTFLRRYDLELAWKWKENKLNSRFLNLVKIGLCFINLLAFLLSTFLRVECCSRSSRSQRGRATSLVKPVNSSFTTSLSQRSPKLGCCLDF